MRIGIIGGGCSGSLVAVHLLRQARPISIDLVEPRLELARGLAYSTPCFEHLLNVPAGKMSAIPGHASQFHEWLRQNGYPKTGPDYFAPRQVYGKYLGSLLTSTVKFRPESFRWHASEAVELACPEDGPVAVALGDGTRLEFDRAILALGNPPPAAPVVPGMEEARARYYNSAWERGALEPEDPDAGVLLIGSGLTAVDALVALRSGGHRGAVWIVSRRGRLPQTHAGYRPHSDEPAVEPGMALSEVVKAVRNAAGQGEDWRRAIDALRPITNPLWQGFTLTEKRRFLRHLKVYWDIHRHRMAPRIGAVVADGLDTGNLEVIAGRLRRLGVAGECIQVEIALRGGGGRTVGVRRIINCTSPDSDYRRVDHPLLKSLFRQGLAAASPLGVGLRADEHGALMGASGRPSDRLFTLGPPRTGDLIETIAVPEIRGQAEALAAHVISLELTE